jgi:LytS/YehU family sensor histidine kinase
MAWFMNTYVRHEKKVEQAQKKQVESELNFLKSQINPHFLFNNLNNLYALSIKNSDKTSDAILQISSLLRYMLYEANVQYTPFYKEKEVIEAYINLELLRFSEVKDFSFNIHADKAYNIPPLLWLPVLENVFKHGTRIIADEYYVKYDFIIENNKIKIYSKNYYKSNNLNHDTPALNDHKQSGGIGFTNLRKRLELLYPKKHSIRTTQDDQFYIVDILINLADESSNN